MLFGASWTDTLPALVTIVSLPFAVVALFQTRSALHAQIMANDLQTALNIWEKIDCHWEQFRKAPTDSEKKFEFGRLTGYYELACGLYNDGILSTKAARTLEEHLDEILPRMLADPGFQARFEKLTSSNTTFENIRRFCDRKKVAVTE